MKSVKTFAYPVNKTKGVELIRKKFLGAEKHLYNRVCPSVSPLRLLIFGGFRVLQSTAWPVLALVLLPENVCLPLRRLMGEEEG